MRKRSRVAVPLALVMCLTLSWSHAASGQSTAELPASSSDIEATPAPLPTTAPPAEDKPIPKDDEAKAPDPERRAAQPSSRDAQRPVTQAPRPSRKEAPGIDRTTVWWTIGYRVPGSYSTDRVRHIAARLKELGANLSSEKLYSPFLVAGRSHWSDTWGQIRHADEGELRPHLGQDVFCDRGAPVLAIDAGTVEFTTDPLGGIVVKLHRDAGEYFYYGHLARWNTKGLSSGDDVETGDVVGFCGKTGNASTTPPHVHFGWINGGHLDPMQLLVDRLRTAENQATAVLHRVRAKRVAGSGLTTTKRLYGERFLPNLSTIDCVATSPLSTTDAELMGLLEPAPPSCPES